jgi:diguanylate cyclase (GGDEF)-like protein
VSGAVIVFRDVGSARARERGLAHLAHHDFLTDLPNRLLFGERVDTAIVLARRHQRQAALLYLDLDGFKPINDTLGHGLGDMLLQSVTQRLVQSVRASDTICRQGGDEFVILLSEIDGPADAAASAGKLLRTLAEPHYIGGRELSLTASIGIALYPKDGREVVALLHRADSAMYEAKRRGRNQYQFFSLLVPDNSTPP